jgi:hypothetical protein
MYFSWVHTAICMYSCEAYILPHSNLKMADQNLVKFGMKFIPLKSKQTIYKIMKIAHNIQKWWKYIYSGLSSNF